MRPSRRDRVGVAIEWTRRHPVIYQAARSGRLWAGRHLVRPFEVEGVPGRVHPNDLMMAWGRPDKEAAYVTGGRRALALVEDALAAVDRAAGDVGSWLDFGCGHGRVVRHLVQLVPASRIWVTDLDPEGVGFCASEFGVNQVAGIAGPPVGGRRFDMIYAFSVLTHLPEQAGRGLLALLGRSLAPGGLLLFTTHGGTSLRLAVHKGAWLADHVEALTREVGRCGFSYRPYPHYLGSGYGLAWHSAAYVTEAMTAIHGDALRLVAHRPDALEGVQDAFVFQRR